MSEDIARADDIIESSLTMPEEDREKFLAGVIRNLVGMTSETDESRVAQAKQSDRLREELDFYQARTAHLEQKLAEHDIDDDFAYEPRPRRKRRHSVIGVMDVLTSALGMTPHPKRPEIREATPTGSITSLPRQSEAEIARDIEETRAATPIHQFTPPTAEPDYGVPQNQRSTFVEKHPTRGVDFIPTAGVFEDTFSTGHITIPAPDPKPVVSVVDREEVMDLRVIETRADRKNRRGLFRRRKSE